MPTQVVGDQFGMGMDDTHMKIRGAPVLDEPALSPHQKMIADKLAVSELMSMAVVALPPVVKVALSSHPPTPSRLHYRRESTTVWSLLFPPHWYPAQAGNGMLIESTRGVCTVGRGSSGFNAGGLARKHFQVSDDMHAQA